MAQRRMFSSVITDSDLFMDMPKSAQLLYFHLNMHADDDGFVGNTKSIMRMTGSSDDDLKILLTKQYLIPFETGVTVIKDWHIHNYIRSDRKHPTKYTEELKQLELNEDDSYSKLPIGNQLPTSGQPDDGQKVGNCHTEVRLGKDRLGKVSKERSTADAERFDWQTVIDYLNEKTGKRFKHTDSNKRLVVARHKDGGYTVDDMKQVIDNQCADWLNNPNMNQYLRPATLFRASKFEGYLNNGPKQSKPTSREDWFGETS